MTSRIVFYVAHLGIGGAQKIASFVMNECLEAYPDVHVVAYWRVEEQVGLDPRVRRHFLFDGEEVPSRSPAHRAVRKAWQTWRLAEVTRRLDPDCVVLFGPDPLAAIALRLINYRGKVVECERGCLSARHPFIKAILKISVARCDMAVFQTDGARREYGRWLPVNTRIVPNPCYVRSQLVREVPIGPPVISAGGRLVKEKGFECLVRAFALVHRTHPDASLVIYGDGPERSAICALVEDLDLAEVVSLYGAVNDLGALIVDSTLFVLSSEFEGLPNTLIEAMVLGIPVVATDCRPGGARFLTRDGSIGGPLVPVGDTVALADSIDWVLDHSEEAELLGRAGKQIAVDYSPKWVVREWLGMFAALGLRGLR